MRSDRPVEIETLTLTPSDRGEALAVLAAAFRDYPVMRFVLGESGPTYAAHLEALIGFFVEARLRRGWPVLGVRDGEELVAAALVSTPHRRRPGGDLGGLRRSLEEVIGEEAHRRLLAYDAATGRGIPEDGHHFLGMLGALPRRQGGGWGGRLLAAVQELSRLDPESRGVYLDTEREANLPFYRRAGFRVHQEIVVEGLRSWGLFWPSK